MIHFSKETEHHVFFAISNSSSLSDFPSTIQSDFNEKSQEQSPGNEQQSLGFSYSYLIKFLGKQLKKFLSKIALDCPKIAPLMLAFPLTSTVKTRRLQTDSLKQETEVTNFEGLSFKLRNKVSRKGLTDSSACKSPLIKTLKRRSERLL